MLAIVAIGAATVVIILAGITSELSSISGHLDDAKNTIAGWLTDLGVDPSTADKARARPTPASAIRPRRFSTASARFSAGSPRSCSSSR